MLDCLYLISENIPRFQNGNFQRSSKLKVSKKKNFTYDVPLILFSVATLQTRNIKQTKGLTSHTVHTYICW